MKTILVFLKVLAFAPFVQSQTYYSFDDIVRELSADDISAQSRTQVTPQRPGIESVRIHAGVGFINSRIRLDSPHAGSKGKTLNGFEAYMGIDLFSSNWIAEGAIRSFNPEEYLGSKISLREFDLRFVYLAPVIPAINFRGAAGLSARYLDLNQPIEGINDNQFTTPASLLSLGFSSNLTHHLSLGADVAYRMALTSDSIDKGSVDGGLRFVGSF